MKYKSISLSALLSFSLVCCGSIPALASVDQTMLGLVPAETVLLTGIDATTARNSDFGQYLLSRVNTEDQNFQAFTQATGFDPRRDLQSVMFAGFGPRQTHGHSRFAILARGFFDTDRIEAAAVTKGSVSQDYGGLKIFMSQDRHDHQTAFTFLDSGIAVMGDVSTLESIIDHRSSATTLDPGLLDRVNKAGADNDIWFASILSGGFVGDQLGAMSGQAATGAKALQAVQQSSGGVRFGDSVKMSLTATTRSPQDAVSLTDVVRFLTSMAQTQRQSDPHAAILASALDGMQLKTSGSDVYISVSMTEKNLEQLAQTGPRHAR